MGQSRDTFHWADYAVLAAVLAISLVIGLIPACIGGKQKTKAEYLLGNRSMNPVPVSFSILVSFISAVLVIGTPAEVYTRGTQYWWFAVGSSLGTFLAALIFVPLLYPLKLTSSYEYLEARFKSKSAKLVGDLLLIASMIIYMGIATYSPSTALQAVTGFPTWGTILCIGGVATIYTTVGGLKAVIWTDFFQTWVMVFGLIAIVIVGSLEVGGIGEVWRINTEGGRIEYFEPDPDPTVRHTFWSLVIGSAITSMYVSGVNQASVQRYCAVSSMCKAKVALYLTIPGTHILAGVAVLAGCVLYAYIVGVTECDPLSSQQVRNSNQLVSHFMMQVLAYPGVPGVFVSCLFSGTLSTVSSALSSLAAIVWQDMLSGKLGHLSETRQTLIIKFIAFVFGCVCVGMAFAAENMGGTVLQAALAFIGGTGGPLLGMFLLGGLFPCANWLGAVIGGIVGLVLPMWMAIGAYAVKPYVPLLNFTTTGCPENTTFRTISPGNQNLSGLSQLYTISYLWYPAIGTITTIIIGLLVSCVSGCTEPEDVDRKFLIQTGDWLCCCLREKTLNAMRWKGGPIKKASRNEKRISHTESVWDDAKEMYMSPDALTTDASDSDKTKKNDVSVSFVSDKSLHSVDFCQM